MRPLINKDKPTLKHTISLLAKNDKRDVRGGQVGNMKGPQGVNGALDGSSGDLGDV